MSPKHKKTKEGLAVFMPVSLLNATKFFATMDESIRDHAVMPTDQVQLQ